MSRLDMAIGALVAAAILTPEGRETTGKVANIAGGLGNKMLKSKLGVDLNDVNDAFKNAGKGSKINDTRKQTSAEEHNESSV